MFLYPGRENFLSVQLGGFTELIEHRPQGNISWHVMRARVCTPHQNKISMITLHRVDRAQSARIFSLASNCGHTLLYTVTHTVFQ